MGTLWKRRMKVEFPDLKRNDKPLAYEYPPWGITFSIEFDMTPQANSAKVTLWNLSRETIQALKRGTVVKLYAGYEEDEVGLVFAGVVDTVETRYDDVDKLTTLTVIDGKDSVLKARANRSWKAGTALSRVVKDLFDQGGLQIGAVQVGGTYDRGVAFGPQFSIAGALNQVLRDAELKNGEKYTWYVDLGYGYFVPREWEGVAPYELKLTPHSGLIEQPEPLNVVTSNVAGEQAEPQQWRVRVAFNWRIFPGLQLHVDCKRFKGKLKVVSGTHVCTPTDKFESELVCDQIDVELADYDYISGDERTRAPVPGVE